MINGMLFLQFHSEITEAQRRQILFELDVIQDVETELSARDMKEAIERVIQAGRMPELE